MAEFVPDGHKYGVKWDIPWGCGPELLEQSNGAENLFLSLLLTAQVNGSIKALVPAFYGNKANDSHFYLSVSANSSLEWYVIFDAVDFPLTITVPVFAKNILSHPLAEGQFLARFTAHTSKTGISIGNFNHISSAFVGYANIAALTISYSSKRLGDSNVDSWPAPADIRVEFSAQTSPNIVDMSCRIGAQGLSSQTDPKYGIITKENKVFCYWDDYEVEALGAGGIARFEETDGPNLISFAKPQPLNCVYRNNGGGGICN